MISRLVQSILLISGIPVAQALAAGDGGFTGFDGRAQAGERLTVVFFGCSLTWGANASDHENTSYRALIRDRLEARYPQAHFRCRDAAIGGTGSQLGLFRLERDCLRWKPDLVFVDFTANDDITSDDPETLASYQAILHRLAEAKVPVVQVAFPFRWNIGSAELPKLKRLALHRALAEAYGNGWGDAVSAITGLVEAGKIRPEEIWVTDGIHPHDAGYRLFADAAWQGFERALAAGLSPRLPKVLLWPATYLSARRVRLADLGALPAGWDPGRPNLTSVYYDFLMSRWLDGLVVARNRGPETGADGKAVLDSNGKPRLAPRPVARLRLKVSAATVMVYGEATAGSGRFRVWVDGALVASGKPGPGKDTEHFEGNRWNGNGHLVYELARGLDPGKSHVVEIEPVLSADKEQELRLESLCVAGGDATASLLP